jgi:hypothetical protein
VTFAGECPPLSYAVSKEMTKISEAAGLFLFF